MKSMSKAIHIIAFDVPYPPNYGGIVDVFFKLKTLHELGAKIIYHCFYYKGNNSPSPILDQYCDQIYYYERKKNVGKLLMSKLPFVVASRYNKVLLDNLLKDKAPIFFDGIQTAYFLSHPFLKDRIKLFRANNIEHDYYKGLAQWEKNQVKKAYYKWEAKKLQKFEQNLRHAQGILSVAKMDIPHFSQYAPTHHVPPFFNQSAVGNLSEEIIPFCLFQGNLSVTENQESAIFIIKKLAPLVKFPIKLAGKNPPQKILDLAKKQSNIEIIANPPQDEMEALINTAQVNLLFTFQQTGIKLKLLHALESGKHIIINSFMDDSGIFSEMCDVANEPSAIADKISELMQVPFTKSISEKRAELFGEYYNNKKNGQKIIDLFISLSE